MCGVTYEWGKRKPPTNRLCQLLPDMVVMPQHNVKLVILFHIAGTHVEEARIRHKDVVIQGDTKR